MLFKGGVQNEFLPTESIGRLKHDQHSATKNKWFNTTVGGRSTT